MDKKLFNFIFFFFFNSYLIPSPGNKWRSHRKLIAPTFHLNVLKGFIDLFNENSRQVIKKLDKEMGKTFDAHDHMSEATVEILLGKKCGKFSLKKKKKVYTKLSSPSSPIAILIIFMNSINETVYDSLIAHKKCDLIIINPLQPAMHNNPIHGVLFF